MESGVLILEKVEFIKDRGAFISFSERKLDLLFFITYSSHPLVSGQGAVQPNEQTLDGLGKHSGFNDVPPPVIFEEERFETTFLLKVRPIFLRFFILIYLINNTFPTI